MAETPVAARGAPAAARVEPGPLQADALIRFAFNIILYYFASRLMILGGNEDGTRR